MTKTLNVSGRDGGHIGMITLAGGRLIGSTPSLQRVADAEVRRLGSAASAYAYLDGFANAYIAVRSATEPLRLAVRRVHAYGRVEGGKHEHVAGYVVRKDHQASAGVLPQSQRFGNKTADAFKTAPALWVWMQRVQELEHDGKSLAEAQGIANEELGQPIAGVPQGWIPHAKWIAGQQIWEARGEAAWDAKRHPYGAHGGAAAPAPAEFGVEHPLSDLGSSSPRVRKLAAEWPETQRKFGEVPTGGEGQFGDTKVVTLADGTKVIHKVQNDEDANDREELASYVMDAVDANGPAIMRAGPYDLMEEFIPGVTYEEYQDDPGAVSDAELAKRGRNIGLLDYLVSNTDRNPANWMVSPDGNPIPIDMGFAQFDGEAPGEYGWEEDTFFWPQSGDMAFFHGDHAAWQHYEDRLEALLPEFRRLDHEDWYLQMMQQMRHLEPGAKANLEGLATSVSELAQSMSSAPGVARRWLAAAAWSMAHDSPDLAVGQLERAVSVMEDEGNYNASAVQDLLDQLREVVPHG